jgi:hypothetical protein
MGFEAANEYCIVGGGRLISFNSGDDISHLHSYLRRLDLDNEMLRLGLRFSLWPKLIDVDGVEDTVVVAGSYYAPSPGTGNCVATMGGLFFRVSCTAMMRFICEYAYSGEEIATNH